MSFNSKDFNAEKVRSISFFAETLKNKKIKDVSETDEFFACYFLILTEILHEALLGNYNLNREYKFSNRQEIKILRKIKKEFQTIGFQFNISVNRKEKTFTYEIIWNKN